MILVNVTRHDGLIKSLEVSGHANSDKIGKDLVCAGVSSIVIGGINALESEIDNITIINKNNKLGVIVNKSNSDIQTTLKTILIQLKTIEQTNKKYIQITEE